MNKLVCDNLIRLKNSYMRQNEYSTLNNSTCTVNILNVLQQNGYINSFAIDKYIIKVRLSYVNGESAIQELRLISTPGKQIYINKKRKFSRYNTFSILLMSTNQGITTQVQSKSGLVIAEVY